MDKREAQEVVNETVSGLVGGYIVALMVIAALPIVGWALLFGLAGAVAFPGAAAMVVAGLVIWAWAARKQKDARWARERAAKEARLARLKEPHGGKDRYFVCESTPTLRRGAPPGSGVNRIKLMSFNGGYAPAYYCAHAYDLNWMHPANAKSGVDYRVDRDMRDDPKRLAHWQAVFEEWIETGVQPSQQNWWMFPDEAAQYEEREAERQQRLKMAVCPENSLTFELRPLPASRYSSRS
jgi:hypothetical protein